MRSRLIFGCGYVEEHPLWKILTAIFFHRDLLYIVLSGATGLDFVNHISLWVWTLL